MAAEQSNIAALKERNFLLLEQAGNPLVRVENPKILENMIDPTTGQPYEGGIVLEGEFASLDILNNNNRIYSEENYIGFIEELKKKVWSQDGVYGEYEHPKGYATDGKNVSHKILDIWYDKEKKKVFGIVLLLNTTNGRNAMEVIKSGGRLGISARAGGKEITNPNGTITATIKLMVTFDLVWHPGFTTAKLDFVNLNEDQKTIIGNKKSFTIYETNLGELDGLYEAYLLDKDRSVNFLEWVDTKKLFESAGPDIQQGAQNTQDQQMQDKLENNQNNNEQESEDDLQDAVDQELTQKQHGFYQSMQQAQLGLGRKMKNASRSAGKFKKQGNSYYDNSAGFVQATGVTGMDTMSQDDDGISLDQQKGTSDAQGTGFLTEMYDENPYAMKQQNQGQKLDNWDSDDDLTDDPYGLGPDHGLVEDFGGTDGRMFNGGETEQEQMGILYERQFSGAERKQLASEGKALPDGSFPIVNEKDLKNAISTYGLSKDKPRAKKWIVKRAKALGKSDLIPKSWT
jgi:hypothetical protein